MLRVMNCPHAIIGFDALRRALIAHGLPLAGESSDVEPSPARLEALLREAFRHTGAFSAREREAFEALLLALWSAFPTLYGRWLAGHPVADGLLPRAPSGRIIKLARTARARVCSYL